MAEPIDSGSLVAAYKQILRDVLEARPAGIRRRLADVLATNRSFITHLSNPVYATPIPAQYVDTIFSVCHFAASERDHFLAAYERAHPGKLARPAPNAPLRHIELRLPDLQDAARNAQFDRLLQDFALRIAHLVQAADADLTTPRNDTGDSR
jgi:hypothetical protein